SPGRLGEVVLGQRGDRPPGGPAGRRCDRLPAAVAAALPGRDADRRANQMPVAELIREAALEGVRDELRHSVAVVVKEMICGRLVKIYADVYVERPSQKAIVIGGPGGRLKEVGNPSPSGDRGAAGLPAYLDLHVRVAKDRQRDPKHLRRLGF